MVGIRKVYILIYLLIFMRKSLISGLAALTFGLSSLAIYIKPSKMLQMNLVKIILLKIMKFLFNMKKIYGY